MHHCCALLQLYNWRVGDRHAVDNIVQPHHDKLVSKHQQKEGN